VPLVSCGHVRIPELQGAQSKTQSGTEQQRYLAYMLRLWQVSSDGEPIWRTSLESPHTGEHKGFASLDDLFDFLRNCLSRGENRGAGACGGWGLAGRLARK